jgi:hypothetical protein
MPHNGTFLHFILYFVLLCLPLVTSQSLYAQNSQSTVDIYSSNHASTRSNTRLIRRMQQAVVGPVSGTIASSGSQHSPTRSHAVASSFFGDDRASSSTDPPHAPQIQDIETGIIQPSAASMTTATPQTGHRRTQQPPAAQQIPTRGPVGAHRGPLRRKACFKLCVAAAGSFGATGILTKGLATGETALTLAGCACMVVGGMLTAMGLNEYDEVNYHDYEPRESRRRILRPRDLIQIGPERRALAHQRPFFVGGL